MININSKDCKQQFYEALKKQIKNVDKAYDEICIACIGTDRCTGDSLGPLVGYKLSKVKGIKVVGNLDKPLHGKNIEAFSNMLKKNTLVIAVDACLGKEERIGTIGVRGGSISPGAGVKK